jgi:hypothetical protein
MNLFGDSFDQSLTQPGLDMSHELKMHIVSTNDTVEAAPLPNRPIDDLGILHGERSLDHDKRAFSGMLKSMAGKIDIAVADTKRRMDSGGLFGGRGSLRSSCSRRKAPPVDSSYERKRAPTGDEANALMQLQDMLDHDDVVKNIRNCSSYFDASCEQFKLMVRRFLG